MKFFVAVLLLLTTPSPDVFAGQKLPDYSSWYSREYSRPYFLEGREVELLEKSYETIDLDKKLYKAVTLIHNENKSPWLILYVIVPGEFLNGHGLHKDFTAKYSVFEYVGNSWKFKKGFSLNLATGYKLKDFLKKRYNLD